MRVFPRLRNDLELMIIHQHLQTVDALVSVSWQALHYLATECRLATLNDGDVFCYQIEGSLCGYVNRVFSQRADRSESFSAWNARQNKRRGDLLDRAATRFGLSWDRGTVLCQKETALMDVSHLALFAQLPPSDQQLLISSAKRVLLRKDDQVFASSSPTTTRDDQTQRSSSLITSLAIVVCGRLDIYWAGEPPAPPPSDARKQTTANAADDGTKTLLKSVLMSIRRGQSIGEQTFGLGLDTHSHTITPPPVAHGSSAPSPRVQPPQQFANELPLRIVAGDDQTELLLISRQLYEDRRHEFHHTQCFLAAMRSLTLRTDGPAPQRRSLVGDPMAASVASPFEYWAPGFFSKKPPHLRAIHDVCELVWRVRTDRTLAKAFFQFPPQVLERLCHAMELTNTLQGVTTESFVVVKGSLRCSSARSDASLAPTVYQPGDIVFASKSAVIELDHPDSLLLVLPQLVVERWWLPVGKELITTGGSIVRSFHQLSAPSRLSNTGEIKRKSLMARQSDASVAPPDIAAAPIAAPVAIASPIDALATLLQRMGMLTSLPRFLLRAALGGDAMLLHRRAGDVLFQENEYSTALVLVLSGFVAFYSLEHLNATLEMFRRHPLCHFSSLHHVLTKALETEDASAVSSSSAAPHTSTLRPPGNGGVASPAKARTALSGVHLQTLHAGNVFRVGVLDQATVSPATVIAHTDVELLVLNTTACSALLRQHSPIVDLSRYEAPLSRRSSGSNAAIVDDTIPETASTTEMHRPIVLSHAQGKAARRAFPSSSPTPSLLKFLDTQPVPWLSVSDAKRQLILREMRVVTVAPGELVVHHGDVVSHAIVVLTGSLAVYVRPNAESAAHVLDASQRSVRSLMLERHVTSNYATTSSQLSTLRDARQRQQKRAFLQHKMNRMLQRHAEDVDEPDAPASPTHEKAARGLFVQSVLVALNESKRRQETEHQSNSASVALAKPVTASKAPRSRRSVFRAVVSKAQFQHRIDETRRNGTETNSALPAESPRTGTTAPPSSPEKTRSGHSAPVAAAVDSSDERLLLCHLVLGDVYAEEALDLASALRSRHDVVVESPHAASLLCLDRHKLHAILARTDDDAEQELRGRSNAAKNKWRLAEQRLVRKRSETDGSRTGSSSMPKLVELFRNVLNQRFYLTMRAIADIPLLRELPDHAKRELCMATRFEALERFSNAYKDSETRRVAPPSNASREAVGDRRGDRRPRYFYVVSGRIGVFPRSNGLLSATQLALAASGTATAPVSGSTSSRTSVAVASSSSNAASVLAAHMEQCLVEVGPNQGFGEFEILVPEASRHALLAIALEPTKLLSFPADCFLTWWPTVREMQQNIAYVRHDVPYFSRLELDKISYLYLSLRFQSVARGAKIWEQSDPLGVKEVHLLKEGECSVKTRITVQAPACLDGEDDVDDAVSIDGALPVAAQHELRVLATIADVRPGHIFWLDSATAPFTLVAVSACVTMATIAVDKLRAILSKTPFLELEAMSRRLAARYREQLEVTRETLVRVMNDKRDAELGRTSRPTLLPSLHYVLQAESKKTQLQRLAHGPAGRSGRELRARRMLHRRGHQNAQDGEADAGEGVVNAAAQSPVPRESNVIPYGRILASRPIDIKTLTAHREEVFPREDESLAQSTSLLHWEPSPWNTSYALQHRDEHYELPRGDPLGGLEGSASTALRGSFDGTRGRSLHAARVTSQPSILTPLAEEGVATPSEPSTETKSLQLGPFVPKKPNETKESGGPSRRSYRLRVEVTVPEPVPAPNSSQDTEEATATPLGRRSVMFNDESPVWHEMPAEIEDLDDDVDAIIDVRRYLMAEMQAALAPLRSIRLEPSQCKLNSLGKYLPTPLTPATPRHAPQKHNSPRRSGLSTPPAVTATTPSRQDMHQMKRLSGASSSVRESRRLAVVLPTFSRWRKQQPAKTKRSHPSPRGLDPLDQPPDNPNCVKVVRRQGFLEIAEIPQDVLRSALNGDPIAHELATQRRRRYFSVVDDQLLEFSESVNVHALRQVQPAARHSLAGATLRDAPVPSSVGDSDALLRHSFVLSLSLPPTDFLLTAESLMDRKQWMQALRDSVELGAPPTLLRSAQTIPNGLPGSPQYRHRHTIAKIIADQHRERRRLTLLNLLASNQQASGTDQVLDVEYRIN
ncbi:hypothetical protein P43SY_001754 [Pythium insidiosum]|uniref:Cyclic nucleotide-binding domain-containing protein n=1 Tax=Pythium insidiosum TaxID=114742 RepID=A0AAD5Q985_PYTIN|nr:hypothetical protein P43SY_001754 [Pythium insidiosum]